MRRWRQNRRSRRIAAPPFDAKESSMLMQPKCLAKKKQRREFFGKIL